MALRQSTNKVAILFLILPRPYRLNLTDSPWPVRACSEIHLDIFFIGLQLGDKVVGVMSHGSASSIVQAAIHA